MKVSVAHEIEIIYKGPKIEDCPQISGSKDIYQLAMQAFNLERIDFKEFFYVFLLNRANRCVAYSQISMGSTTGTVACPREVIQLALLKNAVCVIVAHNHPSGNLKPSEADRQLTSKIKMACQFHEIAFLDHLIVTKAGYYSFADEGLI